MPGLPQIGIASQIIAREEGKVEIEESLKTLTQFFNEIIGAIIPGLVLGTGFAIVHLNIELDRLKEIDGGIVFLIIFLAFAAGHGLLSIYSKTIQPPLEFFGFFNSKSKIKAFESSTSYKLFEHLVNEKVVGQTLKGSANPFTAWTYNDLRNIAFSVSGEAASIGRRFMFISLLCSGIGTALLLINIDFITCSLFLPDALVHYQHAPSPWLQVLALLFISLFYIKRGDDFFILAMNTPFSIANVAVLRSEKNS